MNMQNPFRLACAVVTLSISALFAGQAAALTLPTGSCGPAGDCLLFENFNVYSLSYLNYLAGYGTSPKSGDPYYVKSAGADINNAIVIATHPGGRLPNTDLGLGATLDNAYDTPDNIPHGASANYVMAGTDPSPTFTGDNTRATSQVVYGVPGFTNGTNQTLNLWDIQTSALRSYLGTDALTFFFNLNETNKGGIDDGQDMYGWMRVTLSGVGTDGIAGTTDDVITFDLSGNITLPLPDQSATQTTGSGGAVTQDNILPTADDMWAHVHGEICVSTSLGLVGLRPCMAGDPADAKTVNQNLGADIAAFALFNQQLSDLVRDPNSGYSLMTVDARMAHIDNGYEQLFILGASRVVNVVPEPATLALMGLGLLGLGVSRRAGRSKIAGWRIGR